MTEPAGIQSPLSCSPCWTAAMELSIDYLREKLQQDLEVENNACLAEEVLCIHAFKQKSPTPEHWACERQK
ncbi:PREDICTED: bolA-like protein 2 [Galeopterus variegatus]|uniref:BolA-like protein 2 n=1 Tax=Galeopterus variegatus TaxID=482537 RepID=A0ABM0QPK1_GALVR|nr:PREDICTED: bolA-like protein 2 [Galeopterus variegatus]